MLEHDLGIRAHVHEHDGIGTGEAFFQRHQGGSGIAADMAGDEGEAVDAGRAVGPQAHPQRPRAERRILPLAREEGVLDRRFVGLLADAPARRA